MADFSEGGWSKLNDDSWMAIEGGRINVAKPGNLGIQCLKCAEGYVVGNCDNCGNDTYKLGSSSGNMGLFCSQCERGFTSLTCFSCSCENPINRNTIRKKGCYIVTATCGISSDEVSFFYMYRDEFLQKFWAGRKVISIYYLISPFLAERISKNKVLKSLSYKYFVSPLYKYLSKYFS